MREIRRQLQHMLSSGDFALLDTLKKGKKWRSWPSEDRELLAEALVQQGRAKSVGDASARARQELGECFALATQIAPASGSVYRVQARAHWDCYCRTKNLQELHLAIDRLKKALQCSPGDAQISSDLAKSMIHVPDYARDGEFVKQIEALLSLGEKAQSPQGRADIHHLWGMHFSQLFKITGEPLELTLAIDKFRRAHAVTEGNLLPWQPYCRALEQLGQLMGQPSLLREALVCLQKSLAGAEAQKDAQTWSHMGEICQTLFELEGQQADFLRAERAFGQAALLAPDSWHCWFKWGALYVVAGKLRQQMALVRFGLEKLGKAHKLSASKTLVMSQLAECQTLLGTAEEDLRLLKLAKRCLQSCAEKEPFDSLHFTRLGLSQLALGKYFGDSDTLMQAYHHFQDALALFGNLPEIHAGLAQVCSALAESTQEPQLLERALEHFEECACLSNRQIALLMEWAAALIKQAEYRGGDQDKIFSAVEKLQAAMQICEQMEISPDVPLLFSYGCALDFLGDLTGEELFYERAVQVLSQVLKLEPSNLAAQFNLALVFSHIGEAFDNRPNLELAVERLCSLARLNPEDELVWQEWGISLMHLARMPKEEEHQALDWTALADAEVKLRQALRLGALTPLYHLAGLHAARGHKELSLNYLEKAIREKAVPSFEEVQEDEWLENIRGEERFGKLSQTLRELLEGEEGGESPSETEDSSNSN